MDNPRVRLGELLVRAGLITGRQLDEALAEQGRVGKRLGSLLVEIGLVSETQVTQILSQQLSVPWVSLHHIDSV
jgi:type IV pilus assembly protein PilB